MSPHSYVLVVEDEPRYQRLICANLKAKGYRTISAETGNDAIERVAEREPELVILDLGLPDIDGLDVTRRIREFSEVPIVIVTARSDEADIVAGLENGADDYLTKPFGMSELVARIRASLRRAARAEQPQGQAAFDLAGLHVDYGAAEVSLSGEPVKLTATEYRLIRYLSQNAGVVLLPDQILENVWGPEYVGDEHLVRVYVSRVRKKIEDDHSDPQYIVTRSGVGYMMKKPEAIRKADRPQLA